MSEELVGPAKPKPNTLIRHARSGVGVDLRLVESDLKENKSMIFVVANYNEEQGRWCLSGAGCGLRCVVDQAQVESELADLTDEEIQDIVVYEIQVLNQARSGRSLIVSLVDYEEGEDSD